MVRALLVMAGVMVAGLLGGCTPGGGQGAGATGQVGGAGTGDASMADDAGGGEAALGGSGGASGSEAADARYVLDLTMNRIDGRAEALEAYKGKVVLVVNVASACGLTPQYEGLQALYEAKGGEGLVVLGFPANNFGGQEPGTNTEIEEFCTGRYEVTFPMFEKISVVGEDQHALYRRLSQEGGAPTWNFTKYLVDREGRVVARFDPRTRPDDAAMLARIDELLAP